jgi:hydrogenase nickel incorporation protein HypA/HybF
MHEMSIASSILDAVAKEVERHPGARAVRVGVRIGALAAIDPEALRFCFDAIVSETEQSDLLLDIEVVPRKHRCLSCNKEFEVHDYDFQCPQCGALGTEFLGGDELDLAFVEVEELESSATGKESS